jgi:LAO/AO transport system kinase
MADLKEWLSGFSRGDVLAASRLMSVVERGGDEAERVLDAIFPRTGRAYRIALTGAGGAGKSTLADALTRVYRAQGRTVGVVAEDPTSPFTGGAVLGDRVRMTHASGDPGVFVRSLASRGSEAGLSPLASELADVLDAFGRDVVLLESMGVGQVETRVRFSADTVAVVLTPESGDEVQGLKAGLLEVADVIVVNKADRPGADTLVADLAAIVGLREPPPGGWEPPVVMTSVQDGESARALAEAVASHRAYLEVGTRRAARRGEALRERVRLLVEESWRAAVWHAPTLRERFDAIFGRVAAGELSPNRAARELAETLRVEPRSRR